MNGFVVRIALRQHVPLRAGVEYYSFENTSGRDRLASGTSIGDVLFRKMIPDALPLLVCQPNHPTFIADRLRLAILRQVLVTFIALVFCFVAGYLLGGLWSSGQYWVGKDL